MTAVAVFIITLSFCYREALKSRQKAAAVVFRQRRRERSCALDERDRAALAGLGVQGIDADG